METTQESVMRSLLRGEISAVETYRQVKEKYSAEPGFSEIHDIEEEHEDAMRQIKTMVPTMDGESEESSGAWGVFAKAATGLATVGGYKAALKVLKEGEEHGLKEYELALKDPAIESKALLEDFIQKQRAHIAVLDKHLN